MPVFELPSVDTRMRWLVDGPIQLEEAEIRATTN